MTLSAVEGIRTTTLNYAQAEILTKSMAELDEAMDVQQKTMEGLKAKWNFWTNLWDPIAKIV